MAQNRKQKKKYKPKDYFVPFIEIASFVSPIERFIRQVENDEVYHDEKNMPLISLPMLDVEELARKGKTPYAADYNLRVYGEIIYQLAVFVLSDETMIEHVKETTAKYDRLFVQRIKLKTVIDQNCVNAAKAFVLCARQTLAKSKMNSFITVLNMIISGIEKGGTIITNYELRQWLVDYFVFIKSDKSKFLIPKDYDVKTTLV